MISKEIMELKNEFLKEIREIETKLDKKLEKQSLILDNRNKEQEEKINLNIQKNEQLYDQMIKEKVNIDKISELFTSSKKLNDMLISHEIRINNLLSENTKLNKSYNRILTDNLTVPGYIGASCQYKNLSEYIQNNINEMSKLKSQRENAKRTSEDIKSKLDNFMKNMLNLVDNTVTRCNQYSDNKYIYIENMLNNKLVEFSEKNMELRTQIFTNFSQTTNKVEFFEKKLNEINDLKESITSDIQKKFDEIKDEYEENKNNLIKNIDEIIKYKNSLNDLIDKKFDYLMKKQKNTNNSYRNDFNLKLKKTENITNVKTFYEANKRQEVINTFKRISTNNSLSNKINEELTKNKIIKRNAVLNTEITNKASLDYKEEKESNKKNNLSGDESSNESNNVNATNNNILKEENKNIKEDKKIVSFIPQMQSETKNIVENNQLKDNENQNNNNNYNNSKKNNNQNNTIISNDNKNEGNIKINNNDNKQKDIDIKYYNTIENTTSAKTLNTSYIDNIKKKIEPKTKSYETNTILNKEKNIKIPKIMSHLIHEKEKVNNELLITKTIINKEHKNNNDMKLIKKIENRNTIIKSNSNTMNHFFQEPKQEKELKAINSDRSIFQNHFYKTSPKLHNIQTQTTKIMLTNAKKAKFPNYGFSYKIINLGSNIKFRESELEKINELKENAKINIDLSSPLTNTYKLYQKKKNEKKNNLVMQSNEEILNRGINGSSSKPNIILPSFNTSNSFYKNKNKNKNNCKSMEHENNYKRRKYTDYENSLESVKSPKTKLLADIQLK